MDLLLFVTASLLLLVVPGPAVLYVVARSIEQGPKAGVISTLGINVGTLVHIGAVAVGMSSVLAASAMLFSIIKYAGAAYLIYLGVKAFRAGLPVAVETELEHSSLRRVFREGIVVNLLNPKTALFFLAFLPQFVDPEAGRPELQMVKLGFLFIVLAITSDSIYALLAGQLALWLRRNQGWWRWQRRLSGAILIILGLLTVLLEGGAPSG